ncbi:unnamed protein product [Brachionus calyciflorus]|uniref:LIM zinc-binding domain-containing protein n=1 Tax=Brachionus calyciflorus TaxID=104777 RepID=A0A813M2A3_9BILA|nr:unnamed protein product [Brachionus calyciflorus]
MLRNSQSKVNRKKVRYGPVRYVNLKLTEPVSTNTFQISELCSKCGTVRTGPHISEGCKNCLIPKPKHISRINKFEFISRSNKSLDKIKDTSEADANKENNTNRSKSHELKPCIKKRSREPAHVNFSINQSEKFFEKQNNYEIKEPKINQINQNEDKTEKASLLVGLESKFESPSLDFKATKNILESKLEKCFKKINNHSDMKKINENKYLIISQSPLPRVCSRSSNNETTSENQTTNDSTFKSFSYENRKKSSNLNQEDIKVLTPRIKRTSKNPKLDSTDSLDHYTQRQKIDFEDKIKFFESKSSLISSSTKSLNNFDEYIEVETYQIPRISRGANKKLQYFGSNKSLDNLTRNQIFVDNLNEVPKLLGRLKKQNFVNISNKSINNYDPLANEKTYESLESLTNHNHKVITTNASVKPRKSRTTKLHWSTESIDLMACDGNVIIQEGEDLYSRPSETTLKCPKFEMDYPIKPKKRTVNNQICEICKYCARPILSDDYIYAEDNYWHSEHFNCCECSDSLADKKYLVVNSKRYCLNCHQRNFSKKCETCRTEILPTQTRFTYEKLNWHSNSNCFKCFICFRDVTEIPFLIKKNSLFCSIDCKKKLFKN